MNRRGRMGLKYLFAFSVSSFVDSLSHQPHLFHLISRKEINHVFRISLTHTHTHTHTQIQWVSAV